MIVATGVGWTSHPARALGGELAAAWDALNHRCGDLPFLSADCVAAALEQFGTGRERLYLRRDATDVSAAVVLQSKGPMRQDVFQPSQLPLGASLFAPGLGVDIAAQELLRALPWWVVSLGLTQLDPRLQPRPQDSATSIGSDYIETGWVDLAGDFESYWRARGKNLRENMRKQRRKLAEAGTRCTLRIHESVDAVKPALHRYSALETSGWKAREGTAIAPDNAQGRFYASILDTACARHEGRIYEYAFDDRTVAMELCLLRGDAIVILKTAYDEAVDRAYSPAFLMRQEQIEQLFAEGRVKRIEFYGRFMEWHGRWTGSRCTLYHLTSFRWPIIARLRARRTSSERGQQPVETAGPSRELTGTADAPTHAPGRTTDRVSTS